MSKHNRCVFLGASIQMVISLFKGYIVGPRMADITSQYADQRRPRPLLITAHHLEMFPVLIGFALTPSSSAAWASQTVLLDADRKQVPVVQKCTFVSEPWCDARGQRVAHCVNAVLYLLRSFVRLFHPTNCAVWCV